MLHLQVSRKLIMMCDASDMLAAALEQMDGIIAGTTKSWKILCTKKDSFSSFLSFAALHSHQQCSHLLKLKDTNYLKEFLGSMHVCKLARRINLHCECFCRFVRTESMRSERHYKAFPLFQHWWNLMLIQYATTILSISGNIRAASEKSECLRLKQEWISWRLCFSIHSVIMEVDVPLFTSSDSKPPEHCGHSHPTCVWFWKVLKVATAKQSRFKMNLHKNSI